jgi:hypothetical protein
MIQEKKVNAILSFALKMLLNMEGTLMEKLSLHPLL